MIKKGGSETVARIKKAKDDVTTIVESRKAEKQEEKKDTEKDRIPGIRKSAGKARISLTKEKPDQIHIVCADSVSVLSLRREEREIPWHWQGNDLVLEEDGKRPEADAQEEQRITLLLVHEGIYLREYTVTWE